MGYAFPRVGALTERIDIQQNLLFYGYSTLGDFPGGYGNPWDLSGGNPSQLQSDWQTVVSQIWAELIPVTGKEFQAAESTRPAASVRWRIRYLPRVAGMDTRITRVRHKSGIYNVTYIEDAQNAHVELYIVSEREDP